MHPASLASSRAARYHLGVTSFTVNGQPVHYALDPATPLLWALRDASNLTGTKYGCGIGLCGACTVHVDGNPTRACQVTIATLEGSFVTTIEGLSPDRSHPVQQAWIAENVPQCGYCQSGMVMAAAALLAHDRDPTDAMIDQAITNLCRCGTYPRIRRAIRRAARVLRGEETIAAAPPPHADARDAAAAVPALEPPSAQVSPR
jgi:isoquinoline 1-oxidoreductase alpha subunit